MRIMSVPYESAFLLSRHKQDSQFVTPVGGDRPLEGKTTTLKQSSPTIEEETKRSAPSDKVFICKFLPPRKKKLLQHISLSAKKCVASEQSETSQSPSTVRGNCLVPKLN
ncbi:Hypothetical predicted protein [Xyrichtys novacula]|uniref:Uncharacterized protein n=1 Tax=Xyrichtys novacula TaxID=13765 RepID=A0AAV1EKL5_XYRNO|nr:Hypothetical predicted protein [Xyrichtys novacula]